jgi:hypothetical protein
MAIVGSRCDYEATLAAPAGSALEGQAKSRLSVQDRRPALAGNRPTISVDGDVVRVESDPHDAPWPGWRRLPAIGPFCHLTFRKAELRGFELIVPGIGAVVRAGYVGRLQLDRHGGGPGFEVVQRAAVTLLDGSEPVGRWVVNSMKLVDWEEGC